MTPLLLCEPNVSEGRDLARLDAFAEAVDAAPGVRLIHRSADPDHHRMVLAYLGPPGAVVEATRRLAVEAFRRIDLRVHRGRHPRLGALDVVPFVRLGGLPEEEALEACRTFGEWVGARGIPVYYYERSATAPERRALPAVRAGGFEGLAARMEDPRWRPDSGPSEVHPTAGAVITGVRDPLVRFNVDLATPDPDSARAIAREIRESGGGLPSLRALGFELPSRGLTQVSMNLTDFRTTSLVDAYAAVRDRARARGVGIAGVEVIGPVPSEALRGAPADILDVLDEDQVLPEGAYEDRRET